MATSEFVGTPVDVDPARSLEGVLEEPVVEEHDPVPGVEDEANALESVRALGPQAARAVALAVTQQGVRETPPGSNRNPYSAYFGFGPQFWCADFVGWAFDRTGNRDRKVPWGYPSAVRNITAWAQRQGLMVRSPRKGDIFTHRDGSHTGIVTGVSGTRFTTIEGNTSGPGDGRTVYVARHTRATNDGRYWFVRWPW